MSRRPTLGGTGTRLLEADKRKRCLIGSGSRIPRIIWCDPKGRSYRK